jgi:ferric-chelate reductase
MALTLMPISKNAFYARVLHISPVSSIRYHQLVGNLFLFGTIVHGYVVYLKAVESGKAWKIPEVHEMLTAKVFSEYAGIVALVALVLIRLFSLPVIRRKTYEVFVVSHLLLPIVVVIAAGVHANTAYIFSFPAAVLYVTDLWFRFRSSTTYPKSRVTMQPCGITKIEVKDMYCKINAKTKNGRFYNIKINSISSIFSHPIR